MKIAIVGGPYVSIPPKQYGGIEQVIHNLIKGLNEAGHTPILLAPGDSQVDCELIPTTPTAINFPRFKKDLPKHEKLVAKVNKTTAKLLRELVPRIDLIHSHGFDMLKFANFPNLTTLHNKIDITDVKYYLRRKNLFYVSISKNQQAVCPDLKYAGVVYNGEDASQFPIDLTPEDYVCFLGRFDRDKSPHLAIQLAINLGIKIKLAGKIDYLSDGYFEDEIEKYLKHPLVEYLGELGFDEKVELLSKAKCNLHPTNFREPFGLTVIEAAYCGTPTLAIARGAMPELIEPGRTGILVEDFVEGLHQIENIFSMDRQYIASRARQLFNYTTMAEKYIEAYHKVIEDYASRPANQSNPFGRVLNRLKYAFLHKEQYRQASLRYKVPVKTTAIDRTL